MTSQEMFRIDVDAVIFKEDDMWVAQGLQFDICAQAASLDGARAAFAEMVCATAAVSIELGHEPLFGIDAAPKQFWDMYRRTDFKVEPEEIPLRAPRPVGMPRILPRFRIYEAHAA